MPEHVRDGLEAWDRLSADIGHFDVLVTDHEMPGLKGGELVELARQAGFAGRIRSQLEPHSGSGGALSPIRGRGDRDQIIPRGRTRARGRSGLFRFRGVAAGRGWPPNSVGFAGGT